MKIVLEKQDDEGYTYVIEGSIKHNGRRVANSLELIKMLTTISEAVIGRKVEIRER